MPCGGILSLYGGPGSSKLANTAREKKLEEKIYDVNIREKIKSRDHHLFKLLPRPVAGTCNYNLRKNSRKFFYLMAQLLVGPRGQIHFLHLDSLSKLLQVILLLLLFIFANNQIKQ